MAGKRKDISNQKYGKLTVIDFSHMVDKHSYWNCKCECGNMHKVRVDCLKSGLVKSCGCLNYQTREHAKTHGKSNTKLYRVFYAMIQRCEDETCKVFKHYAGRGISICDEWRNDFVTFYNWAMMNGYKECLTIDRINNNGNYEPSNCRWITQKEQNLNTRRNVKKKSVTTIPKGSTPTIDTLVEAVN